MADATEKLGATIVLIVIFMSLFIILLGNIPPEMIVAQPKQFYEYGYDETYSASQIGLEQFAYYLEYNVTYGVFSPVTYDYGSENLTLVLRAFFEPDGLGNSVVNIEHLYWYAGPLFYWDEMNVESNGHQTVTLAEAQAAWEASDNQAKFFPVYCDHKTDITLLIKDTNSSRNNLATAWSEGTLEIGLGMGFYIEAAPVAMNGWALIAQLLSFQAPAIFGMTGLAATVLDTIMAVAIWAITAYLIYRLVLMAIPFVGG